MDNLTARLLGENFEEALNDVESENGLLDTVRIYRDAIRELHRLLATAKAEGAAEAYEDIRAQADDLRKDGGIRASLLRLLTEECVSRAAAIRKGLEGRAGGGR